MGRRDGRIKDNRHPGRHRRRTGPGTGATLLEVGGIAATTAWATAAAIGYVVGGLAANLYRVPPCLRALPAARQPLDVLRP